MIGLYQKLLAFTVLPPLVLRKHSLWYYVLPARLHLLLLVGMTKRTATEPKQPDQAAQQLRVGRELADTTWRIAIPVLLFAGAGILADRSWGSKPWLTLLGTLIGFGCAAALVKRQLDRWPSSMPKPGSYERNRRPGDDDDKDYYDD